MYTSTFVFFCRFLAATFLYSCRVEKAFDGLLKKLATYQTFEAYSKDVKESTANAKVCDKIYVYM